MLPDRSVRACLPACPASPPACLPTLLAYPPALFTRTPLIPFPPPPSPPHPVHPCARYLRIPLLLRFFSHAERVVALCSDALQVCARALGSRAMRSVLLGFLGFALGSRWDRAAGRRNAACNCSALQSPAHFRPRPLRGPAHRAVTRRDAP